MAFVLQPLSEYVSGQIWLQAYPIRYAGATVFARMTVIRLADGRVWLHSPSEIDAETKAQINAIGPVAYILAPGTFHHFWVQHAQLLWPDAETFLCPGLERKRPDIDFDWMLGDQPDPRWAAELDQCFVRGNRIISEVVFLHKPSKTLIVVDVIENIGDKTPATNWVLKLWWKVFFRKWNEATPAPEYQMGWKDKTAARKSLNRILSWEFERVILAHGELIESDAKAIVRDAWRKPLLK